MGTKKIIAYVSVIVAMILSLLLSMLNFELDDELVIAKWATAGILSVFVFAISILSFNVFGSRRPEKFAASHALKIVAIPMLVIVIAAIGMTLIGREYLLEKLFLRPPFGPMVVLWIAAIAGHLASAYLTKIENDKTQGPNN